MNRRFVFVAGFLFAMCNAACPAEQEGRAIASLKEAARVLNWSEDVLVGVKSPREDFQVFGIANVPFQYLSRLEEKSYLQWLTSDHLFPLERAYEKHMKTYEKFNFQQNSIQDLGLKAYRAYQVSYTPQNANRLILNKTVDVVEILTDRLLVTIRDERVQTEANAVKLLSDIYPVLLRQDSMESLPRHLPASIDRKNQGPSWPPAIDVGKLLPYPSSLESKTEGAWRKKNWHMKYKKGSFFSKSAVYEMINREGEPEDRVRVSIYSYGTLKEAEIVLDSLATAFKSSKNKKISKTSPQEFWVYRQNGGAQSVLFSRGVFVVEVRFLSKEFREPRRTDRLKVFQAVLQESIDGLFSKAVRD